MVSKSGKITVEVTPRELKALARLQAEEEGKKAVAPFFQLSRQFGPAVLAALAKNNPMSIQILMYFSAKMDKKNVIVVSQRTMADDLGVSRQTVYKAIKYLHDNNLVAIGKVGQQNAYIVNEKLLYQGYESDRSSVACDGVIVLGQAENRDLFKKCKSLLPRNPNRIFKNKK